MATLIGLRDAKPHIIEAGWLLEYYEADVSYWSMFSHFGGIG